MENPAWRKEGQGSNQGCRWHGIELFDGISAFRALNNRICHDNRLSLPTTGLIGTSAHNTGEKDVRPGMGAIESVAQPDCRQMACVACAEPDGIAPWLAPLRGDRGTTWL